MGREFDYIYVRNFLCVGIPYFLIGVWVKIYNPFKMSVIPEKLNNSVTVDDLIQYYGSYH